MSQSQQKLQIIPFVQHIIFLTLQDKIMIYSFDKVCSQYNLSVMSTIGYNFSYAIEIYFIYF